MTINNNRGDNFFQIKLSEYIFFYYFIWALNAFFLIIFFLIVRKERRGDKETCNVYFILLFNRRSISVPSSVFTRDEIE